MHMAAEMTVTNMPEVAVPAAALLAAVIGYDRLWHSRLCIETAEATFSIELFL